MTRKEIEVDLQGEVPDQIKRDIEYLHNQGFDPEKLRKEAEKQKREEEAKANLLLPQSCMPTIGELASFSNELSDLEFETRLRNVFKSLGDAENIVLEFTSYRDICICEKVLREYQPEFKQRYIRALIHPRMRDAVLAFSQSASVQD